MKRQLLVAYALLALTVCGCSSGTLDRVQALSTLRGSPNLSSVVVDAVTDIKSDGDGHGHPVVLFTFHDSVWDAAMTSRSGAAVFHRLANAWRVADVATR